MKNNLTSTLILFNTERILYPWREAIKSVLPISDRVIINACHDNTEEMIAFGDFISELPETEVEKIVVIKGVWGDKSETISELTNQCLAMVETEWYLNIQADESVHDNSYKEIRWLTGGQKNFTAARVRYNHFVHDFDHIFPFSYERVVRIANQRTGWASYGDGMELVGGEGQVWNSNIWIHHYGKVDIGRSKEAALKEYEFQKMFVHLGLGFPDPLVTEAYEKDGKIDYRKIFHADEKRKLVWEFNGTHPAVMYPYMQAMKQREQDEVKQD